MFNGNKNIDSSSNATLFRAYVNDVRYSKFIGVERSVIIFPLCNTNFYDSKLAQHCL
jgi:hypothetical protein